MLSRHTYRWKTDPENIELLNYLIEKTENVNAPMSVRQLCREYREKYGNAKTEKYLYQRFDRLGRHITNFEHIATQSKVKIKFALSAPISGEFLNTLKKIGIGKVDKNKRITHYKAKDGSLELNGDHSTAEKYEDEQFETVQTYRELITNYFEKNNAGNDEGSKTKSEKEMGNLIEFISEKCASVDSPLSLRRLAQDFINHFKVAVNLDCLSQSIRKYSLEIQKLEFLETRVKVKQLFCLNAPVNSDYLKKLQKDALVEIDEKNRITHYKSNDGSLELKGDHSTAEKLKSGHIKPIQDYRRTIINYFENKSDADENAKTPSEKEMIKLIEFITEKCNNADSPLNICQLARDFNNLCGRSESPPVSVGHRINVYCREIQKLEHLNTPTKVKQLFSLSAPIDSDYLEKLQKDALVEVDEKNRITYYTAKDGSLELRGDHSALAKRTTGMLGKRLYRNLVNNYFENKNNADSGPKYQNEKEMWKLIEFITEKCKNVKSPLNIDKLTRSFENETDSTRHFDTFRQRVKGYCREIQKSEQLDTLTKVKQIFGLGASLNPEFLKKLQKDAVVEVDERNRITKYSANDGSLTLEGKYRRAKTVTSRNSKKNIKKSVVTKTVSSDDESDNEGLDDDSEEYSSEEFGSEFGSDKESDLNETEVNTEPSTIADDLDLIPNCRSSPSEMTVDDMIDYDPTTEIYPGFDGTEMKKDEEKKKTPEKSSKIEQKPVLSDTDKDGGEISTKDKPEDSDKVLTSMALDPETLDLIDYLIERTKDAKSPIAVRKLCVEYKETSGSKQTLGCLRSRIRKVRSEIHMFVLFDTKTKIKMLFALSAPVTTEFLKELKDAVVEVDESNRITYYKANDGSLELRGDHCPWAKRTAENGHRTCIRNYFEHKDDADRLTENKEVRDVGNLIEFITEECENVDSPLSVLQISKDFTSQFGVALSSTAIKNRISEYCRHIPSLASLETHSKVKQLFGLSASVNPEFLKELQKDAVVEVDDRSRITKYTANDGSLTLQGKLRGARATTLRFFNKKKKKSAVSKTVCSDDESDNEGSHDPDKEETENVTTEKRLYHSEIRPEYTELLNYVMERAKEAKSPIAIQKLSTEYEEKKGDGPSWKLFRSRIFCLRSKIHRFDHIDMDTKIKLLFVLSVPVREDFLEKLKDAVVEVDERNRITYYKANDGSLKLRGDHSMSSKQRTANLESKRSHQKFIKNYLENKHDADEEPINQNEKEMGKLIKFVTEKCESIHSPLNIHQLTRDFNENFRTSIKFATIYSRMRGYCRIIQKLENLDTHSKVKQLFGLSASINPEFLKNLQKDAVVEVDHVNRITKYKANDGSLTLQGKHRGVKTATTVNSKKNDRESVVTRTVSSDDKGDNEGLDDDSDEYSSEEFGSEFDSDEESDLNETEVNTEPSTRADDLDSAEHEKFSKKKSSVLKNTSVKAGFSGNRKKKRVLTDSKEEDEEMSMDDGAGDFEKEELGYVITSSGRVSKKRVANHVSQNQIFSSSNFKTLKSSKRKTDTTKSSSSKRTKPTPDYSMRPDGMDDYDPNYLKEDPPKVELQPFRGRILDNEHLIERDEDIRRIQKPYHDIQVPHDNTPIMETPIKIEYEEVPVKEEYPTEQWEVKPEKAHNSKFKFLEAINSLILYLDTTSLSQMQSKIQQKMQKVGGTEEVIMNDDIVPAIESLIVRMISSSNLSETDGSVSLKEFLWHLKAAILNFELMGLDCLLENIKEQMKDLDVNDKNIPVDEVASVLQATLANFCF